MGVDPITAGIMGGTQLIGGILGANAASSAADAQAQSAANALNFQKQTYQQTQQNLSPFITMGTNALTNLQNLTGTNAGGNPLTAALTARFNPTDLANTPGYQFTLGQGLQATQNQLTAMGLGNSGNAVQGATNFATGLANTTYNQQLQNYLAQNQQTYNMLSGQVQGGQTAASNLGSIGAGTANSVANTNMQIGNAQAAGIMGSTNALTNGLSGAANMYGLYSMLSAQTPTSAFNNTGMASNMVNNAMVQSNVLANPFTG